MRQRQNFGNKNYESMRTVRIIVADHPFCTTVNNASSAHANSLKFKRMTKLKIFIVIFILSTRQQKLLFLCSKSQITVFKFESVLNLDFGIFYQLSPCRINGAQKKGLGYFALILCLEILNASKRLLPSLINP